MWPRRSSTRTLVTTIVLAAFVVASQPWPALAQRDADPVPRECFFGPLSEATGLAGLVALDPPFAVAFAGFFAIVAAWWGTVDTCRH